MKKGLSGCVSLLASAALLLGLSGCGSSNNDQGVSFSALGWYSVDDEEGDCEETGVTAAPALLTFNGSESEFNLDSLYLCFGVRNNLSTAGIRTDRAYYEYFIEGASIAIPSSSSAFSVVLGPNPGGSTPPDSLGGTLPGGFTDRVQIISGLTYMPTEVATFLALNREYLPPLPFRMTVRTRIGAVTTAGDHLISNPVDMSVEVVSDNPIPGTAPSAGLNAESDPVVMESE